AASEEAVRKAPEAAREDKERARLIQSVTGAVAFVAPVFVLAGVVGFLWWQSKALPEATKQSRRDCKTIRVADRREPLARLLTRGQCREPAIVSTSFVGATLYRAVFDRALLCGVDLSEADLRGTSFWTVSINSKTYESLRNTAWWLATGWGADDVKRLLRESE